VRRIVVAALLCLACGSANSLRPKQGTATRIPIDAGLPEPAREAVIEGELRDSTTQELVAGGTIVATPQAPHVQDAVAISDHAGRDRLAVPQGTYHVVIYYGDATIDRGDVHVGAQEVVRLDQEIDHAVIEAANPVPPSCPAADNTLMPPAEAQALLATVLGRFIKDPKAIHDGALLSTNDEIYIASDTDARLHRTEAGLPQTPGTHFVLKTLRELQDLADRTGTKIHYLGVLQDIAGDCATVQVDVKVMQPRRFGAFLSCCCTTTDLYNKRNGTWIFRTHVSAACA
jgi:hypothetical protein